MSVNVLAEAESIAAARWAAAERNRNLLFIWRAESGRCTNCGRQAWWTDVVRFPTCRQPRCDAAWRALPDYLRDQLMDAADFGQPIRILPEPRSGSAASAVSAVSAVSAEWMTAGAAMMRRAVLGLALLAVGTVVFGWPLAAWLAKGE